jgi:hypothetical protein
MNSVLQLVQKASRSNEQGGQNFTAALTTMCVIDFCAGFYVGKVQPSTDEVAEFVTKYFQRHNSLFVDVNFSKQFYRVFRHGLAHQWSPKMAGVAMSFGQNEILLVDENSGIWHLNFPPFFELTKKALKDYENDLAKDSALREKFDKRCLAIAKKDEEAARELAQLLKKQV